MDGLCERPVLALTLAGALTMLIPASASAAPLLGPNIQPANQSQTVTEGAAGAQTLTYSIGNPNPSQVTFGGVLQFQLMFLGGDDTDVPVNFRVGGGTCFVNFPTGPAAVIPANGACTLNFTYTVPIDESENTDEGSSRIQFVTAFQEDVSGTTTSAFGFVTVKDAPEPSTAALLGSAALLAYGWKRRKS
jgi:hypothetical protein